MDAVHFAAHAVIDVKAMECDFLVCSPYKFYGPHAGALYGRAEVMAELDVPKLEVAPPLLGANVRAALKGRALAEARMTGTYSLNPRVRSG